MKTSNLAIIFFLVCGLLTSCLTEQPTPINTEPPELTEVTTVHPEITPTVVLQASDTPWPTPTYLFPTMPGGYLARAITGDFLGTKVFVGGSFTDIDIVRFKASLMAFEEQTGISVIYVGGPDFADQLATQLAADQMPDIVDFSQPHLLAEYVARGAVIDPTTWISTEWLLQQYHQDWLELATIEDQSAGLWHRFRTKSLVWYPKEDFEAAGYQVPTNWEEMITLMDQIDADGSTPWCIGFESGLATGWPATDWLEDFVLRTTTTQNYNDWAKGELPFSSPEIKHAAETMAEIWFKESYIYGGTSSIAYTFFGDSPLPLFSDPPGCWLHKQESLITSYFPDGAQPGYDYGVFLLPEIDPTYGQTMLVTGDIMVMFNDRPEVRALMEYFTTPNSVSGWLTEGGALAVHQTANVEMYANEVYAMIASLVPQSTGFQYDASNRMPPEVGMQAFWLAMTNWVSKRVDLDTALAEIDASWP